MPRPADVSVDEFLGGLVPPARRLVEAARKRVLAAVPHATERVRLGWRLIGYNAPAYFAFITVDHDRVRIGFEWGVLLDDPLGLLQGTGSQVRYVDVRSAAVLKEPALTALLQSAAEIVPLRKRRTGR